MDVQYRIQHRKFSPDVIEEGIEIEGKMKWRVKLAPIGLKYKEDELTQHLMFLLNKM